MSKEAEQLQTAWGLPGVVGFFDTARSTTAEIYPSEWVFLRDLLREGMSVLDIGCAQGGFAGVLAEHLSDFRYTGTDVNPDMIARAQKRHPGHRFLHAAGSDLSALGSERFDLVLVLGILHLHTSWRDTISTAWERTGGDLVLDLREIDGKTVEDQTRSYFRMDFGGGGSDHREMIIPYNLINSAEALATIRRLTPGTRRISHFGYLHPVSASAVTPVKEAMTNVWHVMR